MAAIAASGGGSLEGSRGEREGRVSLLDAEARDREAARRSVTDIIELRYSPRGIGTTVRSKHEQMRTRRQRVSVADCAKLGLDPTISGFPLPAPCRYPLPATEPEVVQSRLVCAVELLSIIGRGAFGEVRLCREHASGTVFAMKTMRKSQLVDKGKVAHVWAERCAMAEAADGNPWLVQLHHAWCSVDHVYLVMDYLPGGDLMSRTRRT